MNSQPPHTVFDTVTRFRSSGRLAPSWVSPFSSTRPLDREYAVQRDLIIDLQKAWRQRDIPKLLRFLQDSRVEDFFDPEHSDSFCCFVSLGGIDVLCGMLLDDVSWFRRSIGDAIPFLVLLMRALTEMIIVDNDVAWYVFEVHQQIVPRCIRFLSEKAFFESSSTLLEHIVSVVGPVICIPSDPIFSKLFIPTLDDAVLSSLCRVVALLCVPGMMSDSQRRGDAEAFPQCLTRMRKADAIASSNIKHVLTVPGMVSKLLSLVDYKSQGIRIYQGNRTMTVLVSPQQQSTLNEEQMQMMQSMMQNPNGEMEEMFAQLLGALNQQASAAPQAPIPATAAHHHQNHHYDDEHEMAAVQVFGNVGNSVSHATVGVTSSGASPEMSLEQLANTLSNELPPANDSDSASFGWLTAQPDGRVPWRLRRSLVLSDQSHPSRDKKVEDAEDALFRAIAQYRQQRTSAQQRDLDEQSVVNAQSEVLFVLNSLLSSVYRNTAWMMLMETNVLQRLLAIFDNVFATSRPNSYSLNASGSSPLHPPVRPSLLESSSDSDDDNEDEEGEDDASTFFDDDEISSSSSEDDPEFENHRHDPETLRKIEVMRLIHEIWNAQDVMEHRRLFMQGEGSQTLRETRLLLATRVVDNLVAAPDDSCVETQMLHAVEAYIRSFRGAVRVQRATEIGQKLLRPLATKIFSQVNDDPKNSALKPLKRLEGALSLIAEIVRYNQVMLRQLADTIQECSGDGTVKHAVKILVRHPSEAALLLRSLLLSRVPELRCESNLVFRRKSGELFNPEPMHVVLERVFYVRSRSRKLARRICKHNAKGSGDAPSLADIVDTMWFAPGGIPPDERRNLVFAQVPSTYCNTRRAEAQLSPALAAASDEQFDLMSNVDQSHPPGDSPLQALVDENSIELLFSGIRCSSVIASESTERLCVITTSVLWFVVEGHKCGSLEDATASLLHRLSVYQEEKWRKRKLASCSSRDHKALHRIRKFCIFSTFFRELCMWIAHYSCHQRYVDTLHFSTDIPFHNWERAVLHIVQALQPFMRQ